MTSAGGALARSGKVRDVYDAGDHLVMVASDRISAFDVVLPTPIPGKGVILTQLSSFWFDKLASIVPNHMTGIRPSSLGVAPAKADLDERAVVVRRAARIDIECVVRGYLAGSAWSAYRSSPVVFGHTLPADLRQADRLPQPIFTPAIKADSGHDLTISLTELRDRVGADLATELERVSLTLYAASTELAGKAGIVVADTKFELGWIDGELTLIDEVLTPDSSRFWDASTYSPGGDPPSFDKQYVRDWLSTTGWDKEPPGPELPVDVVDGTVARYTEAFERLTGTTLHSWLAGRAG